MEKLPQFNDIHLFHKIYEHLYRTTIAPSERPLPSANPDLFMKSAKLSQLLLNDAQKVMHTFSNSQPFAKRLMTAAQESNKAIVTAMIRQTGIQNIPEIIYNPDGIRFDFHPKIDEDLCHVIVSLKWRNH